LFKQLAGLMFLRFRFHFNFHLIDPTRKNTSKASRVFFGLLLGFKVGKRTGAVSGEEKINSSHRVLNPSQFQPFPPFRDTTRARG